MKDPEVLSKRGDVTGVRVVVEDSTLFVISDVDGTWQAYAATSGYEGDLYIEEWDDPRPFGTGDWYTLYEVGLISDDEYRDIVREQEAKYQEEQRKRDLIRLAGLKAKYPDARS